MEDNGKLSTRRQIVQVQSICTRRLTWMPPLGIFCLGYQSHDIMISNDVLPDDARFSRLWVHHYIPGTKIHLEDGYYVSTLHSAPTMDAFIYDSATATASIIQVSTSDHHSVKGQGIKWLLSLGVKKIQYIAVLTSDTPLDLPFSNEWSGGLISDKYFIVLESLPAVWMCWQCGHVYHPVSVVISIMMCYKHVI